MFNPNIFDRTVEFIIVVVGFWLIVDVGVIDIDEGLTVGVGAIVVANRFWPNKPESCAFEVVKVVIGLELVVDIKVVPFPNKLAAAEDRRGVLKIRIY
jgi:hypothetical protein